MSVVTAHRRTLPVAAVVLAAALTAVVLGASPAEAHTALTASAPARGATVTEALDDGHPIDGQFAFTYAGPVAARDVPDASAGAVPDGGAVPDEGGGVDAGTAMVIVMLLALLGFAGRGVRRTSPRRRHRAAGGHPLLPGGRVTARTYAGRAALLTAVTLTLLTATAAPALAHGGGTDATNYTSRITDAPPIEGVQWRVYGGDELLWVENRSGAELTVYGPQDEPYLRIGPDGVWENRNSAATARNQARIEQGAAPESVDARGPAEWVQVSDHPRFAWQDPRIHYRGAGLHPRVTDRGERTHLMDWTVPFRLAGEDLQLAGQLEWVPGPSPWPSLAVGLALTLPALAGLRTQPVGGRWPGLARPAAVVLGALVAANVVFLVDDLLALPLPLGSHLGAAAQTALFCALGVFGAWRGWQARDGAFIALGVGAGALFVGRGLLLWPLLGAAQVPTVLPEVVPRLVAGLNIMQIVPLGIVAFVGTRRLGPDGAEAGRPDDRHAPTSG